MCSFDPTSAGRTGRAQELEQQFVTPEDFSRWVAECVFAFYAEHAQELGFDRLLGRSLEQLERSNWHPLAPRP